MPRRLDGNIAFHYIFRSSRKYHNSFGRNTRNTWRELPEKTTQTIRKILEERDGLICSSKYGNGCGKTFKESELSVDHIIPIRAGGPVVDLGNLQLLCSKCHNTKTFTKDIEYSNGFKVYYQSKVLNGTGRKRHP